MKWNRSLKSIFSILMVIVMLLSVIPAGVYAGTTCPVNGNVIDITDKVINNQGFSASAKYITISGAQVESAVEDGSRIDVTLAADTSLTSKLTANVEIGLGGPPHIINRIQTDVSGNECTLDDGKGKMNLVVTLKDASLSSAICIL